MQFITGIIYLLIFGPHFFPPQGFSPNMEMSQEKLEKFIYLHSEFDKTKLFTMVDSGKTYSQKSFIDLARPKIRLGNTAPGNKIHIGNFRCSEQTECKSAIFYSIGNSYCGNEPFHPTLESPENNLPGTLCHATYTLKLIENSFGSQTVEYRITGKIKGDQGPHREVQWSGNISPGKIGESEKTKWRIIPLSRDNDGNTKLLAIRAHSVQK